jgi:hypothetical protein
LFFHLTLELVQNVNAFDPLTTPRVGAIKKEKTQVNCAHAQRLAVYEYFSH